MSEKRPLQKIDERIHVIRGQRVMLDSDLASISGVTAKRLNEQLERNSARFPEDFAFQLCRKELTNLRSQFATSSLHGGRRYLPWVFTEHGALMLANVLNSEVAMEASVRVVRAFVRLREIVAANSELVRKLADLEKRLDAHDEDMARLFAAVRRLIAPPEPSPKRQIGFHVRERAARYGVKKRKVA